MAVDAAVGTTAFPSLFAPIRIGRTELRNRVALLPQGTGLNRDGVPSDADIAYYEARARGGVGVVICGGTAAHPSSQLRNRAVIEAFDPAAIPALRRRVDAVHRHGAAIFGQLLCLGREMAAEAMDTPPVAPSASRSPRFAYGPHVLDTDEIREHIRSYGAAAANLIEAGHDGVEVHAAHGYLVAQFLSPATNHRTDGYGGSAPGRLRFLIEIVREIRARCGPEPVVGVRLSIDEELAGGLTVDDSIAIVAALAALDAVDYLSLTVGVRGSYVKDMSAPHGVALERIARVRASTTLPVIAAQRILTPALAEQAIVAGATDLVGLSRALIADPDWVVKAARGDHDRIRPCVGVSQECRSHVAGGLSCMVNATAGNEAAPVTLPRRRRRHVLVVGGGPGGLEAARLAAAAGQRVTLVERADEVGGQVRLAARVPARHELLRFVEFQAREARRDGADIQCSTHADLSSIVAERPDLVVLATGAAPAPVALDHDATVDPGAICSVFTALALEQVEDGPVVVCDDGSGFWHAVTAAEHLAAAGAAVTLTTPLPAIAHAVPGESLGPLLRRLFGAGVDVRPFTVPVRLTAGGLEVTHAITGAPARLPAARVVAHQGMRSDDGLLASLRSAGVQVRAIGDCAAPRRITQAVRDATRAVAEFLEHAPA